MKEYRILYGFSSRAKVLTVDSEEQLSLKFLFSLGYGVNGKPQVTKLSDYIYLYNRFDSESADGVTLVNGKEVYGHFFIVKRDASGNLDNLSLSEIRILTKTLCLINVPFVKFHKISPKGHAARCEQAKCLSSLLNLSAVRDTIEYCIDKVPESTPEMVRTYIIEKVELLLQEIVR